MPQTILVTGATGYIASRLIPRLLEAGYHVRCLARRPERLAQRAWYPRVEVVPGDVTQPATLTAAMQGISAAYYLIHSMAAGFGYPRIDLESARNFAQAAKTAGVDHIIYLGGLADPDDPTLALHMKSRIECGAVLREAGVKVTEFRAGVIVGPGSVSFEMIRFIAEQFPIMVGPNWLQHLSQPIATSNVLDYLVKALTTPAAQGKIIELGCQEKISYIKTMTRYAQIRGLKRFPLLLPFVPVWLMASLIDFLTPVERSYAFPLVEGLQNDSLVLNRNPLNLFPEVNLLDYTSAVERALADTHPDQIERVWLDLDWDFVALKHEGMFIDYRRTTIAKPVPTAMELIKKVTGTSLRVGLVRGFIAEVLTKDTIRLKTVGVIPGAAWLEWKVTPHDGGTRLEQTIFFAPKGLPGFLAWYLLYPYHSRVFGNLFNNWFAEL
ncbi:MAG TPA: NAD(P)H-binding protein [Anaerolineales bacterium]|jgi:uncharacterized protein YbjT (DUF2867 family)